MNWRAIEKRQPTYTPWGSVQNVTAYPTLLRISHCRQKPSTGTAEEIPEAGRQTGDHADVVHYNEPASLSRGSNLAMAYRSQHWHVGLSNTVTGTATHLWYSGTLVETMATPIPAMTLPAMIMA